MDTIDRMLAVGMDPQDAGSIIAWFEARKDPEGLERYISARENFVSGVSGR